MTVIALPRQPNSLLDRLRTIQLGLAARGAMGAGLAAKAGGTFTGAYDSIPTIVRAYGMRRLLSAYSGKIVKIRRSTDDAEADIGYTATGDLDVAAAADHIGGGSGYLSKWYDQSGNAAHATIALPANQPLYVPSAQNGKPAIMFDGVDDALNLPSLSALTAGTGLIVAVRSNITLTDRTKLGFWKIGTSSDDDYDPYTSTVLYNSFGSTTRRNIGNLSDASSKLWRVYLFVSSSTEWTGRKNGSQFYTTGTNTVGFSATPTLSLTPSNYHYGGSFSEFVIWNSALSADMRQQAEIAANTYFAVY